MQERIAAQNAASCYDRVNCLSYRETSRSQITIILRSLDRDRISSEGYAFEGTHKFPRRREIGVISKTLKQFREDKIAGNNGVHIEQAIKHECTRRVHPVKVLDPDAGIYENHLVQSHRFQFAVPTNFPS